MNINTLTLPEGLHIITENSFLNLKIHTLRIPKTVTTIDPNAFYNAQVEKVMIPEESQLSHIHKDAVPFGFSNYVKTIFLPGKVFYKNFNDKNIDKEAFFLIPNLDLRPTLDLGTLDNRIIFEHLKIKISEFLPTLGLKRILKYGDETYEWAPDSKSPFIINTTTKLSILEK